MYVCVWKVSKVATHKIYKEALYKFKFHSCKRKYTQYVNFHTHRFHLESPSICLDLRYRSSNLSNLSCSRSQDYCKRPPWRPGAFYDAWTSHWSHHQPPHIVIAVIYGRPDVDYFPPLVLDTVIYVFWPSLEHRDTPGFLFSVCFNFDITISLFLCNTCY